MNSDFPSPVLADDLDLCPWAVPCRPETIATRSFPSDLELLDFSMQIPSLWPDPYHPLPPSLPAESMSPPVSFPGVSHTVAPLPHGAQSCPVASLPCGRQDCSVVPSPGGDPPCSVTSRSCGDEPCAYNNSSPSVRQGDSGCPSSTSTESETLSHPPDQTVPNAAIVDSSTFRDLHITVEASGQYNFQSCRIPVPSKLKVPVWRQLLQDYPDKEICDFLDFGWPIGYVLDTTPTPTSRNHRSAVLFPADVDRYLSVEMAFGAIQGPFSNPPFSPSFMTSPLQTVPKKESMHRRVVVDLSLEIMEERRQKRKLTIADQSMTLVFVCGEIDQWW
ncbi:hypothetical protein Bbelb_109650 [Branchiostoma belcheri]|nr:hypothetical protein Bbelb_109650 [Branchiostoma belcheri]